MKATSNKGILERYRFVQTFGFCLVLLFITTAPKTKKPKNVATRKITLKANGMRGGNSQLEKVDEAYSIWLMVIG